MIGTGGRTLVTGANGFVGSAVLASLQNRHPGRVIGTVRGKSVPEGCIRGPALCADAEWTEQLAGCSTVVHTAARVHVMRESACDPLALFREINVSGTLRLARQAVEVGVQRFIFISSAKVLGEGTRSALPFSAADEFAPQDAYGISKTEAEIGLTAIATESSMEVVIIRPPLVYGPGVKANFLSMMRWLRHGLPLPFGAIDCNRRSLVALDNLVDMIVTCIDHPAAANRTFLVSDGEDLSTAELLRRLAAAMGVPARLLPVPVWMLEAGAAALGKRALLQRLCGDFQVDIESTREVLGWCPPIGVDEGLRRAVAGFVR